MNNGKHYSSFIQVWRKVCTDSNLGHQLVEKNPHHNVQDPIVKHVLHFCSNQPIGYMLQ